jgi:diguanylate cyclase (GGDEF)-like protein
LVLGMSLAFLSAYLQAPSRNADNFEIMDSETGTYNRRYFIQRLNEEISRAKRNEYPLSIALMNVDRLKIMRESFSMVTREEALRRVAAFLRLYLREEDIIARLGETVFAFLLPDIPEGAARAMMENLHSGMMKSPFELEGYGVKFTPSTSTGISSYHHNGTRCEELISQASFALQQADIADYSRVILFDETVAGAAAEKV